MERTVEGEEQRRSGEQAGADGAQQQTARSEECLRAKPVPNSTNGPNWV